jgi:hypothetical protein
MENNQNGKETAVIQEKLAMLLDENRELRRAMDKKPCKKTPIKVSVLRNRAKRDKRPYAIYPIIIEAPPTWNIVLETGGE